jgi:putative flippase GtrA
MRDRATPGRVSFTRFLMYAAMGAAGTACHYAVLIGLVTLGLLGPVPASVLGAIVGAVVNFVLNALVTFRGHGGNHFAWQTASRFFATALLAATANGALMSLLLGSVRIDYRVAQLMVTALLLCATFLVNSVWTFRPGRVR